MQNAVTFVTIPFHTVVQNVEIPFQIPSKNEDIPFQIPSKKVFTPFQTVSQLVPNHPRKTSATPLTAPIIVEKYSFRPSQTLEKIPFTASHAPDQSPLNTAENTSHIPRMTLKAVCNAIAIVLKAASSTGASKLQNPSQIVFIADVTSLNVIPNADSLSLIPAANVVKASLIFCQIAVIVFLKSSFVFHK